MSARISFEEATEKLGRPAELEDAGEIIDDLRQRAEAAEAERDEALNAVSFYSKGVFGSIEKQVTAEVDGDRLQAVEQAAHDLLCWTHQYAINVEPSQHSRHVGDLHPSVYNKMNAAEQTLYSALMGREGTVKALAGNRRT